MATGRTVGRLSQAVARRGGEGIDWVCTDKSDMHAMGGMRRGRVEGAGWKGWVARQG